MRKLWILLCFSYFISINGMLAQITGQVKSYEQNPSSLFIVRKDSMQQQKNYQFSIQRYLNPSDTTKKAIAYYRIAVSYACLNNADSACYYLNKFIDVSHDDRVVIVDKDFNLLRRDSLKWGAIIHKIEQLYLQCLDTNTNKEIALNLFYYGIEDQKYRVYLPALDQVSWDSNGRFRITASTNEIKYLEQIIKKYGFPTISMAGNLGSTNAFLILQHSEKIKKYYHEVKKIYKQNEIRPQSFALLTDRYLMDMGRKQLYGTQLIQNPRTLRKYPNKFVLAPVKDFKNVNLRRKTMGFTTTVEEYVTSWGNEDYIIPETYYENHKRK